MYSEVPAHRICHNLSPNSNLPTSRLHPAHYFETGNNNKSFYLLNYVLEGFEEYTINGIPVKLTSGQGLLINNNTEFKVQTGGKSMTILLDTILINEVYHKMSRDTGSYFMDKNYKIALNLPLNVVAFLNQLENFQLSNLDHPTYNTLAEYFILLNWENSNTPPSSFKQDNIKSSVGYRLYSALEFIHNNINHKITIDDIASEAAISKFHLIRCFKNRFGVTPIQLHLSLKVNRAKDMLVQNPDTKIKEIASLFGYPDIYSFSKHFKKVIGSAPKKFIRNMKVNSFQFTNQ